METESVQLSYFDRKSNFAKNVFTIPYEATTLKDVVAKAQKELELFLDDFELYYGLNTLDKSSNDFLSSHVKSGSTVFIVRNEINQEPELAEPVEVDQARSCLSRLSAMMRGSQKKNVIKTLRNDAIMKPIISGTPGLAKDQTALDFLNNPSLFSVVIDPANIQILMEKHPGFLTACVSMWHIIATAAIQKVTLDEDNSDDEMEMEHSTTAQTTQTSTQSTSQAPIITANQLAEAVRSTLQGSFEAGVTDTSSSARTNRSSSSRTSEPRLSDEAMKNGLQQLREMGFTNESVCRRVLQATNGDVQSAISILFS